MADVDAAAVVRALRVARRAVQVGLEIHRFD
jgi:hypothetical protein